MDNTKNRAEKKAQEIKLEMEKIGVRIEKNTLEIRELSKEKANLQRDLNLLIEIIGDESNNLQEYKSNEKLDLTIEGELTTDKILTLLQQYGDMISADIVKRLGVGGSDTDKFTVHNAIKKLLRERKIKQVELLKKNGEKQKRNVPLTINF